MARKERPKLLHNNHLQKNGGGILLFFTFSGKEIFWLIFQTNSTMDLEDLLEGSLPKPSLAIYHLLSAYYDQGVC